MSLTNKEINPELDLRLVGTGSSGENESTIRFITREIYIDIQCLIMAAQLQRRCDKARAKGQPDLQAEEFFMSLIQCDTADKKAYWLQDYKGRALLSCSLCLRNDVEWVLEIKEPGQRRRFCPECYAKLNMKQLYGNIPRDAPRLWEEGMRALKGEIG